MSNGANTRAGWLAVLPAILWTILFFVLPFIAMLLKSLWPQGSDGWSLDDYQQFFTNDAYWRALTNSLEVTGMVTVVSVYWPIPLPGFWRSSCLNAGRDWL